MLVDRPASSSAVCLLTGPKVVRPLDSISMMPGIREILSHRSLGLVLLLVLVGCSRENRDLPDVLMELAIAPAPPQIGPARVTVMLAGADGQPITGARVELEAHMSHAGMVPVFVQAPEVAPGRYEESLEFTMGGDWFIVVHADLPDGRALERKVDVPGVDLVCGETPAP